MAPEESADPAPLDAPRLPPRYRDQGRIAAGSFGEVRRVFDTKLDRVVAMKLLRADIAGRAQSEARFLAETKLTAGLEHPGIVAVHDGGWLDDGRLWFTMREVRGRTLGDVIAEVHAAAGPRASARRPRGGPSGASPTPSRVSVRRWRTHIGAASFTAISSRTTS